MNWIVCICCLVAIVVLGGVTCLPEQQLDVNKGTRSILQDNSFGSRAKKCGKRKIACANAGGKCQSKTDVCEGKMLFGKIYCKNSKTCGCCVPQPPKGCIFGSTVYPHESFIEEACMNLQCVDGLWIYIGSISSACEECQVFGEPHIKTYEPHNIKGDQIYQYAYQGEGDYIISQQGLDIPDALFKVTGNFIECRAADITCINSINYTEPGIEVNVILPNLEDIDICKYNESDNINICAIKVLVNGRDRLIDNTIQSFYGTDGTVLVFSHNHIKTDYNFNCMNIVGSKGFSVSLCQHAWDYPYLYVWAMPSLANQLYGLCDTFPTRYPDGYTAQNGTVINRKASRPPTSFADSWKIGELHPRPPPVDKCDSTKVLDEITKECEEITNPACIRDWENCQAYKSACIFDLCHVPNHDSYALGYANHMLVNSQISVSSATCSCKYRQLFVFPTGTVGGCYITEAAPDDKACGCGLASAVINNLEYYWCYGSVVACEDKSSPYCKHPDTSLKSCKEGEGKYGNCGGYWT